MFWKVCDMKNIIIEGADGSGKSTLAKILAEKYGMTIFHSGGQKELTNTDEYFKMFKSSENMIFDRAQWFSEFVYPTIFNRVPAKPLMDFILNYWNTKQTVIFCVGKGDVDVSFKPHKSKEALETVLQNREMIYNEYYKLIDFIFNTKNRIDFFVYDFTKDSLDDVFNFIEISNLKG